MWTFVSLSLHVLLRYESCEPIFVEPVGACTVPYVIDEESELLVGVCVQVFGLGFGDALDTNSYESRVEYVGFDGFQVVCVLWG